MEQRQALRELAARAGRKLRERGRSAASEPVSRVPGSVLFAGGSADAVRLAAGELAQALGRQLYRVDLRVVASKYIGETEKHLDRVLETAARTGAVLLFDEGDALFGRRAEVADDRDRYGNLEAGYLLARIEEFEGLAIVACNRRADALGVVARRFDCVIDLHQAG